MRDNYDDDEDEQEVQQLVIPKYKLLYEDPEVKLRAYEEEGENPEEEKEPEEEKKEEGEEGEEQKEEKKKPIERIVTYIAEIMQGSTEQKPISDKELCLKLKERLDFDIDLIQPSISNEEIEENGVWQVIIGKQFTASVTFDAKFIYYFQLEESRKYFLVFRS